MILDQLKYAHLYFGLSDRFSKALIYLQSTDSNNLKPGKYEIEGTNIYALVQQYWTAEKKDYLEAHHRYADIHYILSGVEVMEVANVDDLKAGEYDDTADYLPMKGDSTSLAVHEGSFIIFHPQDAHMPGIIFKSPQMIKKIVIKVLLDK